MSNRKEVYVKGHTYVITRRFLDKTTGKMRVRVQIFKGLLTTKDALVLNEYKDFADMHAGDACFSKQIRWALSLLAS